MRATSFRGRPQRTAPTMRSTEEGAIALLEFIAHELEDYGEHRFARAHSRGRCGTRPLTTRPLP